MELDRRVSDTGELGGVMPKTSDDLKKELMRDPKFVFWYYIMKPYYWWLGFAVRHLGRFHYCPYCSEPLFDEEE